MTHNQAVGEFGENLACKYLEKKGYIILERNVKISYQEIDIIAKIGEETAFIEVKTRVSQIYGEADESLYSHKINNLKKGLGMYLGRKNIDPEDVRLEFIAIDINKYKKTAKIKHYTDLI